jgi:hypothetical protein
MRRFHRLFVLAVALATSICLSLPSPASAQETWQYHMAQANSYYRNKLLPKALEELRLVVADPAGAEQLKAWQLIQEIATKLKDLETLAWSLEKGREIAKGAEAAQMQAQLYRIKRAYGRLIYQPTGGSGKLSTRSVKMKALGEEITDPEAKSYYEKVRLLMGQVGISLGTYWLPVGEYDIDGETVKVEGGKDTIIEVAPTTFATFGVEIEVQGGARAGDTSTGASGFLGGLHVGLGPHIQFASGNSLVINVGPVLDFGAQSTRDVAQDVFTADRRPRLSIGGLFQVGFEFTVGKIDISPRIGLNVAYLASGMYFDGVVATKAGEGDGADPSVLLSGQYVVPAIGVGPRVGFDAMLTPAIVKGKRRPRLFFGVHGGPLVVRPLWGDIDSLATLPGVAHAPRSTEENNGEPKGYDDTQFNLTTAIADEARAAKVFTDIRALLGVQLRL